MIRNKKLHEAQDDWPVEDRLDVDANKLAAEGIDYIDYVSSIAPASLSIPLEKAFDGITAPEFAEMMGRDENGFSEVEESTNKKTKNMALAKEITKGCSTSSVMLNETSNNCDVEVLVKTSELPLFKRVLEKSQYEVEVVRTDVAAAKPATWPGFTKMNESELSKYAHFELYVKNLNEASNGIKPFAEVKVGDEAVDYSGGTGTVIAKGTAEEMLAYDYTGALKEAISEGLVDYTDDAIALKPDIVDEYGDKPYAIVYDGSGAWVEADN